MADTGTKFGTSVAAGGETVYTWTNPGNFTADDSNYAIYVGDASHLLVYWNSVKLIIGGSAVGSDYATSSISTTEAYSTFGGITDKWGLTPTAAQINGSDFGVFVRTHHTGGLIISESLRLTGFTMTIPTGATIDGIKVEIKAKYVSTRYLKDTYMNCARITVYYTEAAASGNPHNAYAQQ
jgi:hypothetical protein